MRHLITDSQSTREFSHACLPKTWLNPKWSDVKAQSCYAEWSDTMSIAISDSYTGNSAGMCANFSCCEQILEAADHGSKCANHRGRFPDVNKRPLIEDKSRKASGLLTFVGNASDES